MRIRTGDSSQNNIVKEMEEKEKQPEGSLREGWEKWDNETNKEG